MASTELKVLNQLSLIKTPRQTFGLTLELKTIKQLEQMLCRGFKPRLQNFKKAKLSQDEFHRVTLIPLSTIKRRLNKKERFSIQESDAMYRLAMLLKLATELFNDEKSIRLDERKRLWFRWKEAP